MKSKHSRGGSEENWVTADVTWYEIDDTDPYSYGCIVDKHKATISLCTEFFNEGSFRKAYKMELRKGFTGNFDMYACKFYKESKYQNKSVYFQDAKMQFEASKYAKLYNQKKPPKPVRFLPLWVIEFHDPILGMGTFAHVEGFVQGSYIKWTNNLSYIRDVEVQNTPTAFSHFTYEASDHKLLVCDIQGVYHSSAHEYIYTDPQIHCVDLHWGTGDLGLTGIQMFFNVHKCNVICKGLGMKNHEPLVRPALSTLPSLDEGSVWTGAPASPVRKTHETRMRHRKTEQVPEGTFVASVEKPDPFNSADKSGSCWATNSETVDRCVAVLNAMWRAAPNPDHHPLHPVVFSVEEALDQRQVLNTAICWAPPNTYNARPPTSDPTAAVWDINRREQLRLAVFNNWIIVCPAWPSDSPQGDPGKLFTVYGLNGKEVTKIPPHEWDTSYNTTITDINDIAIYTTNPDEGILYISTTEQTSEKQDIGLIRLWQVPSFQRLPTVRHDESACKLVVCPANCPFWYSASGNKICVWERCPPATMVVGGAFTAKTSALMSPSPKSPIPKPVSPRPRSSSVSKKPPSPYIKDELTDSLNLNSDELALLTGNAQFVFWSGVECKTIHRWSRIKYSPVNKYLTMVGHTDSVSALSPIYVHFLFSGSEDMTTRQWDIYTGYCLQVFHGHEQAVLSVVALRVEAEDQSEVSSPSSSHVDVLNLPVMGGGVLGPANILEFEQHQQVSKSGSPKVRRTPKEHTYSKHKRHSIGFHGGTGCNIKYHEVLVSSSADRTWRIWSIQNGACKEVSSELDDYMSDIVFHQSLSCFFSVCLDGNIKKWDSKKTWLGKSFKATEQPITLVDHISNVFGSGRMFDQVEDIE